MAALPVRVLWGVADRAFPARYLERWREALPLAKVARIEDAGHWPHEEAPARVLREMEELFAESSR